MINVDAISVFVLHIFFEITEEFMGKIEEFVY